MRKLYNADEIQDVYADSVKAVELDENGEFHLLKAGVIVTHRCTLRCKLCAERTPYYKERYHPAFDLLKKEIDAYFALVDYTMKFEITGGEPTIRADLPELLEYLYNHKAKFGRARLITNGSILFNQNLVDVLKTFGVQADVLIDDYGENLSVNAKKNAGILAEQGVKHILRDQSGDGHFGGWVDFGDLTRLHSDEAAKELYRNCAISSKVGFGWRMKNGFLSPCAMTNQCIEFGAHEGDEKEYVNLFDENADRMQQICKMLNIYNADYLSACAFCRGMYADSERFQPAEQLRTNG